MLELTPEEQRVLGCLVEKQATTPDQYPLTMNGLLTACNQTTNRSPVVTYDEETARLGIDGLRAHGLARVVHSPGQRAPKYRHVLPEVWPLTEPELAVLAVLLLRGPQSPGELRTRTERYGDLSDLGGVDGILHRLRNRHEEPFVIRLERQSGQREDRWAHLLGGPDPVDVPASTPSSSGGGRGGRLDTLTAELEQLRHEVTQLRQDLDELRSQLL